MNKVTDNVFQIPINDYKTDLFEGQYKIPDGISYNSYVIFDEKIAVLDTADHKFYKEWSEELSAILKGRTPDYLVVHHMEPDHSAIIPQFLKTYPNVQIVGNNKTFKILEQFFPGIDYNSLWVDDGTVLNLGKSNLTFFTAPMVHWPEVMVSYYDRDKILFSADAFGKFGALDRNDEWPDEARRYYFGIIGKYGAQVKNLLKKIGDLDLQTICPLHGPVLKENIGHYLDLYDTWSKNDPELKGTFIAYASMYGNTKAAALKLFEGLKAKGIRVEMMDLARDDFFGAIAKALAYQNLIIASPTYNNMLFPDVDHFLQGIIDRNFQNRTVGIIENGSWAPSAAKRIKEKLANSKDIQFLETIVSIKSAMNEENLSQIQALVEEINALFR